MEIVKIKGKKYLPMSVDDRRINQDIDCCEQCDLYNKKACKKVNCVGYVFWRLRK